MRMTSYSLTTEIFENLNDFVYRKGTEFQKRNFATNVLKAE